MGWGRATDGSPGDRGKRRYRSVRRVGAPARNGAVDIKTRARADSDHLQSLILKSLDDDKAEDVVVIDLAGKSSIADGMIIASGRSARHVAAVADHLLRRIKEGGYGTAQVEGLPHADWVLIDAGDIIVHIFRPEVRAYYNLEKMWSVTMPERAAAL